MNTVIINTYTDYTKNVYFISVAYNFYLYIHKCKYEYNTHLTKTQILITPRAKKKYKIGQSFQNLIKNMLQF